MPPDHGLPPLRRDLVWSPGAPAANGAPTWLIHDPLAHRFFQIDADVRVVLEAWSDGVSLSALADRVSEQTGEDVDEADLEAIVRFAELNELMETPRGGWRMHAARAEANRPNWLMWLVHNYLFVKIPLVRPQDFLRRTLPLVEPLYTRRFAVIVGVVTALGLYLVSRQSQVFFATFPYFVSPDGAVLYLLALVAVKALHELGHAYTAVRYGCRVPTIGVAFLVMVPMLYSDVTDAWKLRDRRQRMAIGAAGVAVELVLAGFASCLWAFLPDGGARSVAFLLATTSWIASLAINLSPFMRFDGYFLLSDLLGVANLQSRAFALGRWWLREVVFGLGAPAPDHVSPRMRAGLVAYAYAVWLYRLVVFFGIALLVYHYFFKVLGVILFCVEIGWFIARPVVDELKVWVTMRFDRSGRRRRMISLGIASLGVALVVLPWSGRVEVPAIIEPARATRLFPVAPAQVVSVAVKSGDRVAAGDIIATLSSPKIDHDRRAAEIERASLLERLGRRGAEARDRGESLRLETQLGLAQERFEGLAREADLLMARAPFDGVIVDLNPDLTIGRWIARDEAIADIVQPGAMIARGYVAQADLARLAVGDAGRFVFADTAGGAVEATIEHIAYAGATTLEIPELASPYGGAVAARETPDHALVPDTGVHVVTLRPPNSERLATARGTVVIAGRRASVAAALWSRALAVLIRESGL